MWIAWFHQVEQREMERDEESEKPHANDTSHGDTQPDANRTSELNDNSEAVMDSSAMSKDGGGDGENVAQDGEKEEETAVNDGEEKKDQEKDDTGIAKPIRPNKINALSQRSRVV